MRDGPVKPVYYMLKAEKSRESTFIAMRTIVLAMERLLNLRNREGTWWAGLERLLWRHVIALRVSCRPARLFLLLARYFTVRAKGAHR